MSSSPDKEKEVARQLRLDLAWDEAVQKTADSPPEEVVDSEDVVRQDSEPPEMQEVEPEAGESTVAVEAEVADDELGQREEAADPAEEASSEKAPPDDCAEPDTSVDVHSGAVIEVRAAERTLPQILMDARAAKNLPVSTVSRETKVAPLLIEHLETGRYDLLPPFVYSSGHLRHLCGLYELDAEALVERLSEAMEDQTAGGSFAVTAQESESCSKVRYTLGTGGGLGKRPRRISIPGMIVSALLVLLLVVIIAAVVAQRMHSGKGGSDGPNTTGTEIGEQAPKIDLRPFIENQELPLEPLDIPN